MTLKDFIENELRKQYIGAWIKDERGRDFLVKDVDLDFYAGNLSVGLSDTPKGSPGFGTVRTLFYYYHSNLPDVLSIGSLDYNPPSL